jgi:hypothetical protein
MASVQQNPGMLGGVNVNTGVTPIGVYSPDQTNAGVSQLYANAFQRANLPYLLKKDSNSGTGTSVGGASMQLAAPQIANILSGAKLGAANMNTGDASANANSLLQGQQLNANTALGLASGAGQQQQNQFNQGLNQAHYGMGLLGQFLGSGGGAGGGFLGNLIGGVTQ